MKKQITWRDNILRLFKYLITAVFFSIPISLSHASDRWVLDTNLSTIEFELPVLFAKNVKGKFKTIEGFVELDVNEKENNKAIFSVQIDELEMNYTKYKDLLLSNIFFNTKKFPLAVIDTKKFSYDNEKELKLNAELTLKGKSEIVPLFINITRLAEELVQIQSELVFSRTSFEIGIGQWSNTSILKDKIKIKTNLFLFTE